MRQSLPVNDWIANQNGFTAENASTTRFRLNVPGGGHVLVDVVPAGLWIHAPGAVGTPQTGATADGPVIFVDPGINAATVDDLVNRLTPAYRPLASVAWPDPNGGFAPPVPPTVPPAGGPDLAALAIRRDQSSHLRVQPVTDAAGAVHNGANGVLGDVNTWTGPARNQARPLAPGPDHAARLANGRRAVDSHQAEVARRRQDLARAGQAARNAADQGAGTLLDGDIRDLGGNALTALDRNRADTAALVVELEREQADGRALLQRLTAVRTDLGNLTQPLHDYRDAARAERDAMNAAARHRCLGCR